jgi:hypothetical protein
MKMQIDTIGIQEVNEALAELGIDEPSEKKVRLKPKPPDLPSPPVRDATTFFANITEVPVDELPTTKLTVKKAKPKAKAAKKATKKESPKLAEKKSAKAATAGSESWSTLSESALKRKTTNDLISYLEEKVRSANTLFRRRRMYDLTAFPFFSPPRESMQRARTENL